MNYEKSAEILEKIKSANKILLNCHRNPDADSLGSSSALFFYLKNLGKEVSILSPNDIPNHLKFLAEGLDIIVSEFDSFDFSKFDLFIVTDTSNWARVFSSTNFVSPKIPVVVLDNHETNKGFGDIDLLDYETSSASEMVYKLFEDWNFTIDKKISQALLSGIIGDTGSFQFEIYSRTFEIAQKLMNSGADIKKINFNLFNSIELPLIKFWGLVIDKIVIDEKGFCYSAIPFAEYEKYSHLKGTRETASTMIMRKIEGTKFGFVMTEDMPGTFSVSFRARGDFDVAVLAQNLGGGGHPGAAGVAFREGSFDKALEKVIVNCRNAK